MKLQAYFHWLVRGLSLLLARRWCRRHMPKPVWRPPNIRRADTYWGVARRTGGRRSWFPNNPQKNGDASRGGIPVEYYEYNSMKPGPFLNGSLNGSTNDGLYQSTIWANNVGYEDQHL